MVTLYDVEPGNEMGILLQPYYLCGLNNSNKTPILTSARIKPKYFGETKVH